MPVAEDCRGEGSLIAACFLSAGGAMPAQGMSIYVTTHISPSVAIPPNPSDLGHTEPARAAHVIGLRQ